MPPVDIRRRGKETDSKDRTCLELSYRTVGLLTSWRIVLGSLDLLSADSAFRLVNVPLRRFATESVSRDSRLFAGWDFTVSSKSL
jgi:hypothetical protein